MCLFFVCLLLYLTQFVTSHRQPRSEDVRDVKMLPNNQGVSTGNARPGLLPFLRPSESPPECSTNTLPGDCGWDASHLKRSEPTTVHRAGSSRRTTASNCRLVHRYGLHSSYHTTSISSSRCILSWSCDKNVSKNLAMDTASICFLQILIICILLILIICFFII